MNPDVPAAAQAVIDMLDGTLTMARVLVTAGRQVDLAGLDAEVAVLCATVLGLDPVAAGTLRPALHHLLREVDGLRDDLAAA